jgi:hypothetical protein
MTTFQQNSLEENKSIGSSIHYPLYQPEMEQLVREKGIFKK